MKQSPFTCDPHAYLPEMRFMCLGVLISMVCLPASSHAQESMIAVAVTRCFDAGGPCARQTQTSRRTNAQADRAAGTGGSPEYGVARDDPKFKILLGTFVATAGTDVGLSMYQIGRGTARERGFGAWWQDSPVAFGITKSAAMAFAVYGLERMHKTRPKTAFILGIAATSMEAALVARTALRNPQAR